MWRLTCLIIGFSFGLVCFREKWLNTIFHEKKIQGQSRRKYWYLSIWEESTRRECGEQCCSELKSDVYFRLYGAALDKPKINQETQKLTECRNLYTNVFFFLKMKTATEFISKGRDRFCSAFLSSTKLYLMEIHSLNSLTNSRARSQPGPWAVNVRSESPLPLYIRPLLNPTSPTFPHPRCSAFLWPSRPWAVFWLGRTAMPRSRSRTTAAMGTTIRWKSEEELQDW